MKKMLGISIISTLVLAGGIIWTIFFFVAKEKNISIADLLSSGHKDELYSEPFSVMTNLDVLSKSKQYVKTDIVISTYDKKVQENMEEKYKIPVQDILIGYLNTQTKESITEPSNKSKINDDIVGLIEERVGIDVEGVYFTNFVIQ